MPILLLAQGDPDARDMLRSAIEARYGSKPPAIENLQVKFKGRAKAPDDVQKKWVPVEAKVSFIFPSQIRWDFVGMPDDSAPQRSSEAFDGETYRTTVNSEQARVIEDAEYIHSVRSRLWAMAALILTPLSDHYVNLSVCGARCLKVTNTRLDDFVQLHLRPDDTIERITTNCLNPNTQTVQKHTLVLHEELITIDGLRLPKVINAYWDKSVNYQMTPTHVSLHPKLEPSLFQLSKRQPATGGLS